MLQILFVSVLRVPNKLIYLLIFWRCSDGYFGAPTILGGSCKKCGCNVAGSIDGACNKTTGQCNCDAGITGRICDQCDTHHIITNTGCKG